MGKSFRLILLLALTLVLVGADRAPATAADRTRVLKAAKLMQKKPLSVEARKEGEWALKWIGDSPEVNVTVCGPFSPRYKYERQMMASDVLAMGAFILKNPAKANDQTAVWRAGLDGMLDSYSAIIGKHPDDYDDFYDDLLQQRAEDGLTAFMQEFGLLCYSSKGSRSRI